MSSSTQLRNNKNQHGIKNSLSKRSEKTLASSMNEAVEEIVEKYPNTSFLLLLNSGNNSYMYKNYPNLDIQWYSGSKLSNKMLFEKMKANCPDGKFAENIEDGFINPDGSILLAKIDGDWKIIVVSEHKHQGTNDKRKIEGKKKQAMGNAVERAMKNINFIRRWMQDEDITPYALFVEGCDFKDGSSIRGRVHSMNEFYPFNKVHTAVECSGKIRPISIFMREKSWEKSEMKDILIEIATQSMKYYNEKYKVESVKNI